MSSYGKYVESDIITTRNIIFFKAEETNTHIELDSAPVIGSSGKLKWMNSVDFINSMKETLPIYELQPGLSTIHQNTQRDMLTITRSTVAGIGSMSYISTSGLERGMGTLTYTHGYISSSSLYESINKLMNLRNITDTVGPMLKFVRGTGQRFENRAFVKTANPGSYRIYSSTLGLQGSNLTNTAINNSGVITSGIIDIGGYSNLIIPGVSKMRIDVNIGLQYSNLGKFSTFLLSAQSSTPLVPSIHIGTPVVVNYLSPPAAPIGRITYFLTAADFINSRNKIWIGHRGDGTNATTSIPSFGGIHVTLNNMD
jgi:hypothetical protein